MSQVFLYDTTLRDGSQREDISLSCDDKLAIARKLDEFGVHYIEGGWPGSNSKDVEFFHRVQELTLKNARIAAFGSTRRKNSRCEDDANLQALIDARTPVVTLVGKSWDFHVFNVLDTTLEENLAMIQESVAYLKNLGKEVIFDAEHFFDGFNANPDYAIATLKAAAAGGADWLVLCETNGGRLPWEVERTVKTVKEQLTTPLGVHCHNDSNCAVANSLSAIAAGCTQVQGTINGYGERVGNVDLISVIPNLQLKMGYEVVGPEQLQGLTSLAHFVAEVVNLKPNTHQPFVGHSAFAHKGGIHVAAIMKSADSYQHIDPALVGNEMRVVVSELSGRGNVVYQARAHGMDISHEAAAQVLQQIKELEHQGFTFEAAEASVDLMMQRAQPGYQPPFELIDFTVLAEERKGRGAVCEATVKIRVNSEIVFTAAEGNGPVDALASGLYKCLRNNYPELETSRLTDYKVRILDSEKGTGATTRVLITFHNGRHSWTTVGASTNIIDASWRALSDSVEYAILHARGAFDKAEPVEPAKEYA